MSKLEASFEAWPESSIRMTHPFAGPKKMSTCFKIINIVRKYQAWPTRLSSKSVHGPESNAHPTIGCHELARPNIWQEPDGLEPSLLRPEHSRAGLVRLFYTQCSCHGKKTYSSYYLLYCWKLSFRSQENSRNYYKKLASLFLSLFTLTIFQNL